MELKLQFSSLSVGASVDQQTGNLSVFEVIEELRTPQVPFHIPAMAIALIFEKHGSLEVKGKFTINLQDAMGRVGLVGTGKIGVPAEQNRMKAVFRLTHFPIYQAGKHVMKVIWEDEKGKALGHVEFEFHVLVVPAAPGQEPVDRSDTTH